MSQMPEEGTKFNTVDGYWRAIMKAVARNTNCLIATGVPNMLDNLIEANRLLEDIQRGLNKYLEMKRLYFPR
jgi:dynein heavy chain, axonemal